jgi:hypothetical protein
VLVDKTMAYVFAALAADIRGLGVATVRAATPSQFPTKGHSKKREGILLFPEFLYSGGCESLPNIMESLPASFVLKARHLSGCNLVVANGTIVAHRPCLWLELSLTGLKPTDRLLSSACHAWVSRVYSQKEWAYTQIKPGVVIESLLESYPHASLPPDALNGGWAISSAPDDLKCFTFHGRTEYVSHVANRWGESSGAKTDTFYTRDATPLPDVSYRHSKSRFAASDCGNRKNGCNVSPIMSSHVREAVRICDALGAAFDFMRIDLLLSDQGLVLGELTPYPGGGAHEWQPESFDNVLAARWRCDDDTMYVP